MDNNIFPRLTGTMRVFFTIGASIMLKAVSGVAELRNVADNAWIALKASQVRIAGNNATNHIVFSAAPGLVANTTYTFPQDGATGQVLSTDGAGSLSWVNLSASASNITLEIPFTQSSGTLSLFTPPADAVILDISVDVNSAAAGGSPTIKIGTVSDDDLLVGVNADGLQEVDLKTAQTYLFPMRVSMGATPEAVRAIVVSSAQTFSGNIYVTYMVA